jgi:hypothetical protein
MKGGAIISKGTLYNQYKGDEIESDRRITKQNFGTFTTNPKIHQYKMLYVIGPGNDAKQTAQVQVRTYVANSIYYMALTIDRKVFNKPTDEEISAVWKEVIQHVISGIYGDTKPNIPGKIQDTVVFSSTGVVSYDDSTFTRYNKDNTNYLDKMITYLTSEENNVKGTQESSKGAQESSKGSSPDPFLNSLPVPDTKETIKTKLKNVNDRIEESKLYIDSLKTAKPNPETLQTVFTTTKKPKPNSETPQTVFTTTKKPKPNSETPQTVFTTTETYEDIEKALQIKDKLLQGLVLDKTQLEKQLEELSQKSPTDTPRSPQTGVTPPRSDGKGVTPLTPPSSVKKGVTPPSSVKKGVTPLTPPSSDEKSATPGSPGKVVTQPSSDEKSATPRSPETSPSRPPPGESNPKHIAVHSFQDLLSETAFRAATPSFSAPTDTAKRAMTQIVKTTPKGTHTISESVLQGKSDITIIVPVTINFEKQTLYYDMDKAFFLDCD